MEESIQKIQTWLITNGKLNISDEQSALPSFIG